MSDQVELTLFSWCTVSHPTDEDIQPGKVSLSLENDPLRWTNCRKLNERLWNVSGGGKESGNFGKQ